jgi:hypothetical protein
MKVLFTLLAERYERDSGAILISFLFFQLAGTCLSIRQPVARISKLPPLVQAGADKNPGAGTGQRPVRLEHLAEVIFMAQGPSHWPAPS